MLHSTHLITLAFLYNFRAFLTQISVLEVRFPFRSGKNSELPYFVDLQMKNSQEKRYISKTLKIGNLDDTPPMSIPLPVLISSLLVVID